MNTIGETLFEGKQKDELCEKIQQIPVSFNSNQKPEILADDVLVVVQLDAAIQSAPCISLAIDESTDATENDVENVFNLKVPLFIYCFLNMLTFFS